MFKDSLDDQPSNFLFYESMVFILLDPLASFEL